tara:strand:- start:36 stop:1016 length:981 start_codon:yes stop_codon:yes gene_type:complete
MSVITQGNTTNNYPSFSDTDLTQSIKIPDAYVPSIQSSMAQVSLHCGEPKLTVRDLKAKAQVRNANGVTSESVKSDSYLKRLLVGFDPLDQVLFLKGRARNTHYRLACPWSKRGGFVLPSEDLNEYVATISDFKQQQQDCLHGPFAAGYDDAVIRDQALRGGLFNPNDYPPRDEMISKFYIDFEIDVIDDNFITRIAQEGVDVATSYIDAQQRERFDRFTRGVWEEAHKHISKLAKDLDFSGGYKNNPDRNRFTDSAVEHVERMIQVLDRFNFDKNAEMATAHEKLRKAITERGVNADMLKHNEGVRAETKQALNDVLSSLPSLNI